MTEYEKMINGMAYYSSDEDLKNMRNKAKILCQRYNTTPYENKAEREAILKELLPNAKGYFWVEPTFYCDYGCNIYFGDNFYANHNLVILDVAKVIFGNDVMTGPNVGIYTAYHPFDPETRNSNIEYGKEIKIGNNVWIGGNVTILPGVTIGDNTIVGAGSVVTKDLPANSVCYGNPAKRVKDINE